MSYFQIKVYTTGNVDEANEFLKNQNGDIKEITCRDGSIYIIYQRREL